MTEQHYRYSLHFTAGGNAHTLVLRGMNELPETETELARLIAIHGSISDLTMDRTEVDEPDFEAVVPDYITRFDSFHGNTPTGQTGYFHRFRFLGSDGPNWCPVLQLNSAQGVRMFNDEVSENVANHGPVVKYKIEWVPTLYAQATTG